MAAFEIERPFLAVPGPRLRSSAASRIGAALVLATVVVLTAQLLPSQRARGHGTPQPRGSGIAPRDLWNASLSGFVWCILVSGIPSAP